MALVVADTTTEPVDPVIDTMVSVIEKGLKNPGAKDTQLIQRRLTAQFEQLRATPALMAGRVVALAPYLETSALERVARELQQPPALTPASLAAALARVQGAPIVVIDGPFPPSMTRLK